jgi:hypothetical protein
MTIHYKIVESTQSDRDGVHKYECCVEVHRILNSKAEKDERPSRSDTSASDALDALAAALSKKSEDDDEGY